MTQNKTIAKGIIKRGNSFLFTVALGYDVNGKQIRKTKTFKPLAGTTEKQAEKQAKEAYIDFQRYCHGATNLKENMRFSELVEWYFENYAPSVLKEVTAYNYKHQVEYHLMYFFGNMKLKDITPVIITEFFKQHKIKGKKLSASTNKKLYTILQSIMTQAVKQGFIKESPCNTAVYLPKAEKKDKKKNYLEVEQLHTLLKMVNDYSPFNTIIKVLLYTGMRSGECLGLQWEDIDFENKRIHIRHNLADVGGKHFLSTPKTKSSIRYIIISDNLVSILQEHKREQEKVIAIMGKSFEHPEMVFTSETGKYKDRSALNTTFKKFIANTDFSYITLHSLRHSNATLLLNKGVDLKIISEHLGHSDIGVTANIYADVLALSKAKVASLLDEELSQ